MLLSLAMNADELPIYSAAGSHGFIRNRLQQKNVNTIPDTIQVFPVLFV